MAMKVQNTEEDQLVLPQSVDLANRREIYFGDHPEVMVSRGHRKKRCRHPWNACVLALRVLFTNLLRSYCLTLVSVIAIILAVLSTLVMTTLIDKSYEALYETTKDAGFIHDFLFNGAKDAASHIGLNATRILDLLKPITEVKCMIRGNNIYAMPDNVAQVAGKDPSQFTFKNREYRGYAVLMEFEREKQDGVISMASPSRLPPDHVYVERHVFNRFGLSSSQPIPIYLGNRFIQYVSTAYTKKTRKRVIISPKIYPQYITPIPYDFNSVFSKNEVAWVVFSDLVFDYSTLAQTLKFKVTSGDQADLNNFLQTQSLFDFCGSFACQLTRPLEVYNNFVFTKTRNKMIQIASKIQDKLRVDTLTMSYGTLDSYLSQEKMTQNILVQTTITTLGIIVMSVLIIYVIVDIVMHKHKAEAVVMKVVGAASHSLLGHLLLYLATVSILAILLSYAISLIFTSNIAILSIDNKNKDQSINRLNFNGRSWYAACAVAFLAPLAALFSQARDFFSPTAYSLTRHALSKSREVATVQTSATGLSAQKVSQTAIAVFSVVLGIAILLFSPQILYNNDSPYTGVLQTVFLSFLLYGLSFALSPLSIILEPLFINILTIFEGIHINRIIRGRMISNFQSNRFIVIIYSLSLAFIALVYGNFSQQSKAYSEQELLGFAADADFVAANPVSQSRVVTLNKYFHNIGKHITLTGSPGTLAQYLQPLGVRNTTIGSSGFNVTLLGTHTVSPISPSLFPMIESADMPSSFDSVYLDAGSPLSALYSRFGQSGAILSSPIADSLGLDCTNPNRSIFRLQLETSSTSYSSVELQCIAAATHILGFDFSANPRQKSSSVLLNFESVFYLLQDKELNFRSITANPNLVYPRVFVSVADKSEGSLQDTRAILIRSLNAGGRMLVETRTIKDAREKSVRTAEYTLRLSVAFIISLDLFILASIHWIKSMDETKDIGILLNLGTSKWTLYRMAFVQSIPPVLSGCIIGTSIMMFILWLAGHQAALLSDIPYVYSLPTGLMYTVPSLAILSALIAATLPKYYMLRQGIVDMLR